jgi:hypothetical protein
MSSQFCFLAVDSIIFEITVKEFCMGKNLLVLSANNSVTNSIPVIVVPHYIYSFNIIKEIAM